MHKRASHLQQFRTRRAAEIASTSGGIAASDVFKPEVAARSDADQVYNLTIALQEAQERLTKMSARGWSKNHPDRLRAIAEFQAISTALSRVKGRIKAENLQVAAERDKRWERAFIEVAREMLAGPVYDRLVIATTHRMADRA